jgi:hypothetical protein
MAVGLCDQLYPPSDGARRKAAMQTANATSGFLRLAQEFEAEFGRTALNDRIRDLVPDMDYEPDELHRRLLALPWVDIFTTNWDTLLERACRDVFDRSYDIVRTISEIPVAARPRIVKLHGSFPAYEPFSVTEEDYRTYPTKFAPLVNLVQQSMMETAFVLLGFSGDDPNFLYWSGWVRDNLGPSAPKIYLVGWLELSRQRRRMLEDRNVVTVDFALLPQAQKWPDHARHQYSLEWFLSALELGRPDRPSKWPRPSPTFAPPPSYLGLIPAPTIDVPKEEPPAPGVTPDLKPKELSDRIVALRNTVEVWRWNRHLYPQWLVAPGSVRHTVWMNTQNWYNEFVVIMPHLPPLERLLALRELVWRLDTALLPYFEPLRKLCAQVLDSINCQQKTVTRSDGSKEEPPDLDWSDLRDSWSTLAFAVVRVSRDSGDQQAFTDWLQRLAPFAENSGEVAQQIAYERCQWSRGRLDHEILEKDLSTWNPAKSDRAWALRKAGILAEIGRDEDAVALLKDALADIRRYRRRDQDDIPALSREGWSLWLDLAYRRGYPPRNLEFAGTPEPFDRWRELGVYRCNAHAEYYALLQELEEQKQPPLNVVKKRSFDLGHQSTSVHMVSGISARTLASYQILNLGEVTGLPPEANHTRLLGDGLAKAVHELAESERWSTSLLAMRLASGHSDKVVDEFFTRSHIALYSAEHVESLRNVLLRQIDYALPRCRAGNAGRYWVNRLEVAVEVLSRLTLRFSPAHAAETLDQAMRFYRDDTFMGAFQLADPLRALFARAIETLSPKELANKLPLLFDLPTSFEGTAISLIRSRWPEPADLLPPDFALSSSMNETRASVWGPIVSRLIDALESDRSETRQPALRRLLRLSSWGLLTPDEVQRFASALWQPDHLDEDGLLRDHGLYDWTLLSLPEKVPGQAEAAFRAKYLSSKPDTKGPSLSQRLWMLGAVLETPKLNRPFILSGADTSLLIGLVADWIKLPNVQPEFHPLLAQPKLEVEQEALEGLKTLLLHVDLPEASGKALLEKVESMETSKETQPLGFGLFPALARIFPDRIDALTDRLLRGLLSENEELAAQAARSLYFWLHKLCDGSPGVPKPHPDLVREIGIAVAARRRSILIAALDLSRWILRDGPKEYHTLLIETCKHGLKCLLEEASYSRVSGVEAEDLNVPLLRQRCIRLAVALANNGHGGDPAVKGWIAVAQEDPLPEVRNSLFEDEPV